MVLIWLIVWLIEDTPAVTFDPLNDWGLALIICTVLSLIWAFGRN